MLEVTVKTLDSQNHTFSVSEESTVKEFKEQISPVLNISVEKQRLIFCGKVLKDDKKLSEYDVNGKVIHVVQSLPPQGNSGSASSTTSGSSSTTNSGPRPSHRDAAGFVLGAFTIPQDLLDPNQMQNIVQEVVSGMGELGRNATVISRTTEDGPSVDLRISLGQVPLQSEAQLRMNRVQTMFMRANRLLDSLEDGHGSGNNSSESSSQTDNDEEIRNRLMEAEIGNVIRGDSNGSSRGSGDSSASAEAHNEPMNTSAPSGDSGNHPPVTGYGLEGLAQVAQAALTAAIATATAAARAATSTLSPHTTSTTEANESGATNAESVLVDSDLTSGTVHFISESPIAMDIDPTVLDSGPVPSGTPQENREPSADAASADSNTSQSARRSTSDPAGSGPTPREPSQPSVQTLANLLDEVIRVNTRLEPCLEKCRDLIRNDAVLTGNDLVDAHRLFSKTSQLLHFLSHAYHSLSDLHINFTARPPRSPRVRIISSSPTVFQQAIPLQAQINISSSVIPPGSNPSTTTTANTTNFHDVSPPPPPPPPPLSAMPRPPTTNPPRSRSLSRNGNLPRVASTSSIPSMVRGQNPMFFMEVTPGSITIDSISAAMDASVNALHMPDEDSDASSRDTPTPPASTTASQTETRTEPQTSDAQTSTTYTRTTSSHLLPGLSLQGNLPAVRHLIPVPLTSMGSLQTFDSALPCHSVWALEPSRRRHNAGGSRTTAESQRNARSTGNNATARTPAPDAASQPATATETPQSASTNGTSQPPASDGTAQPTATNGTATPGPRPNISSFLRNLEPGEFTIPDNIPLNVQQRLIEDLTNPGYINQILTSMYPGNRLTQTMFMLHNQGRRSRNGNSSTSAASGLPNVHTVNPERYRISIDELRASSSFPFDTTTLAEFFLNNRNIEFQENDVVGPAVYHLCQLLTLDDFFEASLGNFITFNRIREPLLIYVLTNVFNPDNTEEQNNIIVENIVNNIMNLMEPVVSHLDVWPRIDYRATMRNFFKHNVNVLKNSLLSDTVPGSTEFGSYICQLVNNIVLEFQYLHNACCDCGLFAFQAVFNDFVGQVCTGNRATFRQVLLGLGSTIITREPIRHIDPLFVRGFIVSTAPDHPIRIISPRRVEASASSRVRNPEQNELPREFRSNLFQQTEELVRLLGQRSRRTMESRTPAPSMEEVVIGSENWHNAVPRDWVPIITRDVQRQRRQAPQSPFGDAYLSGMPSKRRKIMTTGAPALLENSKTTLPDMLQQAVASANVKPLSGSEEVKKDASEDLPLQTAFTHHMKNAIQERLQRDLDYCSEKFPNAKKYYM